MKALHSLLLLTVVAGGLAWSLWGVDRGPFENQPVGRESLYWSTARLVEQGLIDPEALGATREPIYPRLLAPFTNLAEPEARRLHGGILLFLAAVALITLTRRSGLGVGATMLACAGLFLSAPLVLQAGVFTPGPAAAILLLCAGLLLGGRFGWVPLGVAALLTAIALWMSATLAWAALALLTVGIWRAGKARWAPGIFLGATLSLALLLGLASETKRPVPTISGIELYQGHRELARGGSPLASDTDPTRFWGRHEYQAHGSREAGKNLTAGALDTYWSRRALVEGFRHLPQELMRTGRKAWLVAQPQPLVETVSPEFMAQRSQGPGFSLALWLGRILLPLGLAGWLVGRKRVAPEVGWLVLSGWVAAWLGYAREDLRSLTLLLLCAGLGLFWAELRGRARGRTLAAGFACLALLTALPLVFQGESDRLRALNSYWLGTVYANEERGAAAMREFDRALAFAPDLPLPRLAVADLLIKDQVVDQAIRELETVREKQPDLVTPLRTLSRLYEERERWIEAGIIHQTLIDINPYDPGHHNNLGTTLVARGLLPEAEAAFKQALALDPQHQTAFNNLSNMQTAGLAASETQESAVGTQAVMALLREQRYDAAESVLALSYAQDGADTTQLRFFEGTLYFQRGQFDRAIAVFEELLPAYGNNPMFRHNLAAAYASVGRLDEALGVWTELVRNSPTNQVFLSSLGHLEQQVVNQARSAEGAAAKPWWELLVKHFPRKTAYAESLKAVSP